MKNQKKPLRLIFFSFLLVCLLTGLAGIARVPEKVEAAPPMQAVVLQPHMVISEFRTRGLAGADDEYVEIFNATGFPVSVNNWKINKSAGCSSSSTPVTLATLPNISLAPGQYYLVARSPGYTGTADQTYTSPITSISDDGGIALLDGSNNIIDQVGMCGTTTYKETTPLSPMNNDVNQSYERKLPCEIRNCTDTNNNAVDFVLNASSSNPQNSASPAVPCLVVTNITSAATDTTYTTPTTIDITVTFSGVVYVAGAPTLLLETGVADKPATYLSGSGTNVLTFRYNAGAGDYSTDLDYVSSAALLLNGGGIYDVIGNAVLTLPVPPLPSSPPASACVPPPSPSRPCSLGENKAIAINIDDGLNPRVVSIKRQSPAATPTNSDTLTFRVTFSEIVQNVDNGDFVVTGAAPALTTVTPVLPIPLGISNVYDVTISGGDLPNLNATVGLNISDPPTIMDQANNALPPGEPPVANDETYLVDNIGPTVTVNQAGPPQTDPTGVTPVNFTVIFSESIVVSEFTTTDITQPNSPSAITWNITNPSGDRKNFILRATVITQTSVVLTPSIAAGRVTDDAGNTNQDSTSTDNSVTFTDVTPPTVTVNQAIPGQVDPAQTLPVNFRVVFSEPINTSTFTPSDITQRAQSGDASGITWTITDSGDHKTFTLSATVVTVPGNLVPSISANRVTDVAGNLNLSSTSTDNSVKYGPPPTATPTLSRTPTKPRTATPPRTPTRRPTLAPQPLVAINEFLPRPGHDWNGDGEINTADEYIELINHGVINVNLNGYRLDDEANIGSLPYSLPSITIKPGERIVFYGNETGLLLSDGGDGVRLLKPNGQLMDAFNYSTAGYPDQAYCRLPDNGGADDWNDECFPTPGLRNSHGSFGTVVSTPVSESLCPFSDIAPFDFVFAECDPFGNNIWRPAYWDDPGWMNGQSLPGINSKWDVYVD